MSGCNWHSVNNTLGFNWYYVYATLYIFVLFSYLENMEYQ